MPLHLACPPKALPSLLWGRAQTCTNNKQLLMLAGLLHSLLMWKQAQPKQLANLLSNRDTTGQSHLQCHMHHIIQGVSHQPSNPVSLETAMLLKQELPSLLKRPPPPSSGGAEQRPHAADLKACDGMISLANMLRQPAYPLEVKCPCNASTTM